MLQRVLRYLILPSEVSQFERDYLRRMNRIALGFFWLHLPVMVLVAWLCGTGPVRAFVLTLLCLAGATFGQAVLSHPRHVSLLSSFVSMSMGGLLVFFGQG